MSEASIVCSELLCNCRLDRFRKRDDYWTAFSCSFRERDRKKLRPFTEYGYQMSAYAKVSMMGKEKHASGGKRKLTNTDRLVLKGIGESKAHATVIWNIIL